MSVAVTVMAGLIAGYAIGRWWALGFSALIFLWFGLQEDAPLSPWFFGLVYGGIAVAALTAGVILRRRTATRE